MYKIITNFRFAANALRKSRASIPISKPVFSPAAFTKLSPHFLVIGFSAAAACENEIRVMVQIEVALGNREKKYG